MSAGLNFGEALNALRAGLAVSRAQYRDDCRLQLITGRLFWIEGPGGGAMSSLHAAPCSSITAGELLANDWFICVKVSQ